MVFQRNTISFIAVLGAICVGCNAAVIGDALSAEKRSFRAAPAASNLCLTQHNQQRAKYSKSALTYNAQLEQAAIKHNTVMKSQNCFSHQCNGEPQLGQRVTNENYRWSGVAENIAAGQKDCNDVMNSWMNSSGHKANILGNYKDVGCAKDGKYWTCVFGTKM